MKNNVKRKVLAALCAALVSLGALTAAGCSKKENWIPAGMKLASSDAVDYILYVPDSWTVDISTGVLSAFVSGVDRSNITMIAFNLEGDDTYLTPQQYWDKQEPQLIATFPDLTYIDPTAEPEDTAASDTAAEVETAPAENDHARNNNPVTAVVAETNAAKYYYTATVTGTTYEYMQVVWIRGGIAYMLTYTAIPDNFQSHLEDVDRILEHISYQ